MDQEKKKEVAEEVAASPPVYTTDRPFPYIAFTDPAVDMAAMEQEQIRLYVKTADKSLLAFVRSEDDAIVWWLRALDKQERYQAESAAGLYRAEGDDQMAIPLAFEALKIGLVGVDGLPEDIEPPRFRRIGPFSVVDSAWLKEMLPPATIQELGSMVLTASTADAGTEKKTIWPSGRGSSSIAATPARPAGAECSETLGADQGPRPDARS